jgi:hypothetical protein
MREQYNLGWDTALNLLEKTSLYDTRGEENRAVAATSVLPFGTTLHTMMGSGRDKDRGLEWLVRILGAGVGAGLGASPGMLAGSIPMELVGGTLGGVLGEIAGSNLVHRDKYDRHGFLLRKYRDHGPDQISSGDLGQARAG